MPRFDTNKGSILISVLLAVLIIAGGLTLYRYLGEKPAKPLPTPTHQSQRADIKPDKIPDVAPPVIDNQLYNFEKIMDRYYRSDPVNLINTSVNLSVDEYNEWVRAEKEKLDAEKVELENQLQSLRRIGAQIKDFDKRLETNKPDPRDKSSVRDYNTMVARRNDLVKRHNESGKAYGERQAAYNETVSRINRESAARQDGLETTKRDAREKVKDYEQWVDSQDDLTFFADLNRFYARLRQEKRRAGKSRELDADIRRVQSIRRELGDHAVKRHEGRKSGLVIVKAELDRKEECYFIVDTGASLVTLSQALVEVLGLSDRLGDEIGLTLAGGKRVKGRKLIIPEITVLGRTEREIDAVVLDASAVGVDGLLGQSFLDRFAYRINKSHPDKLILMPRKGK